MATFLDGYDQDLQVDLRFTSFQSHLLYPHAQIWMATSYMASDSLTPVRSGDDQYETSVVFFPTLWSQL